MDDAIETFRKVLETVSRDNCARYMKNHFPEQYKEILEKTILLDQYDVPDDKNRRISIFERVYCIEHGLSDRPLCKTCGKNHVCGFDKVKNEYRKWCCPRCQASDKSCVRKSKDTRMSRYGTENYNGIEKARETRKGRYGAWHDSEFIDKLKHTKLERYGDENYVNIDKCRRTKLERYGDENYSNIEKNYETRKRNFYKQLVNDVNVVPLFTEGEYVRGNKTTVFKWRCLKCGSEFESAFNYNFRYTYDRSYHVRCFSCFPRKEFSVSEKELNLREFISTIAGGEMLTTDRTFISPLELDIVVPKRKIAFEFDGLYWHSENTGHGDGYHIFKTERCESLGLQLIHVFEDEWDEKQEIVKSRISNLLGVYDETVYARKCEVREIDYPAANEFVNRCHLQGGCHSSYNIGLFCDDELVSVMTFGRSRFNRNYEWELLRFCSKIGYHVVGGAGKLLKFFERRLKPQSLVSYADRRWSTGKLYQAIGFTNIGKTKPNYWYVDNGFKKRYSRISFQKHKLKNLLPKYDEKLTEVQNMRNNGYDRIFDCGNLVFVKNYN